MTDEDNKKVPFDLEDFWQEVLDIPGNFQNLLLVNMGAYNREDHKASMRVGVLRVNSILDFWKKNFESYSLTPNYLFPYIRTLSLTPDNVSILNLSIDFNRQVISNLRMHHSLDSQYQKTVRPHVSEMVNEKATTDYFLMVHPIYFTCFSHREKLKDDIDSLFFPFTVDENTNELIWMEYAFLQSLAEL